MISTLRAFALILLLSACNLTTGPGPEEPPTPVECGAHAWGDSDGDGVGYRLPTAEMRLMNTSGYALDLATLGGVLIFGKGLEVPMVRVNLPGNGWLGLAQVWIRNSTGIVDRAKVQMNEGYAEMRDPNISTHVGCMEVLHCAGLAHQGGAQSCMSDCSDAPDWGACMRDPAKRTPDQHDQEQLAKIYGTDLPPPTVCVQGEFILLTFKFPAPGER